VRAVLDAVGSRRAAVMASQDTGPMAILFAAMHPNRVSQLAIQRLRGSRCHHGNR